MGVAYMVRATNTSAYWSGLYGLLGHVPTAVILTDHFCPILGPLKRPLLYDYDLATSLETTLSYFDLLKETPPHFWWSQ